MKNLLLIIGYAILALSQNPSQDLMTFPQWPGYNFNTFSGLIQLTIDRNIHYVFMTSQSNPQTDPVVLWLNGGPGCSSLIGMMQELGPFVKLSGDTQFHSNPYSWNLKANLLFFESPSGVGFSENNIANYTHTDELTGQDNYLALIQWFRAFSDYSGRDFYIAGESYAGMYVPYTAYAVVQGNAFAKISDIINLEGILIGNGVLNFDVREDSSNLYIINRNFYDPATKFILTHQCVIDPNSVLCKEAQAKADLILASVNPYGIYSYCWDDSTIDEFKVSNKNIRFPYTPWLKGYKKTLGKPNVDAPCLDFGPTNNYFNLDDVKQAMHVNSNIVYETCSENVGENYNSNPKGSYWILPLLKKAGVRILIYSGDQDAAVSIQETLDTLKLMNLKQLSEWTPWADQDKKVAGWTVEYDILTLNIIRAAGHMVPQDQRANALTMFNQFIQASSLSNQNQQTE